MTKQYKLEEFIQNISFPTPAVEINGDSALDLISEYLPLVEGIFNAFKNQINLMSSRVTAVGAGALTNFQRHNHSQEKVLSKALSWIDRAVTAKNRLFRLHMKAIEIESFMARLLDCLQTEDIIDIDNDILGRRFISVNEDDLQTVNDIIKFLTWKQKFGELQAAFTKGYKMLDEHLQHLRDQQKSLEQACATAKSTFRTIPQADTMTAAHGQFIPWAGPKASEGASLVVARPPSAKVIGTLAYKTKRKAGCLSNADTQNATGKDSYTNPLITKEGIAPLEQFEDIDSALAYGQELDSQTMQDAWALAATGLMSYDDHLMGQEGHLLPQLPDQSQAPDAYGLDPALGPPYNYFQPAFGPAPYSNAFDTGQATVGPPNQIGEKGFHDDYGLVFPSLYESFGPTFQTGWTQPKASTSGVPINNAAETQAMVDFPPFGVDLLDHNPEAVFNTPFAAPIQSFPDAALYANPVDTIAQHTIGPNHQVVPMGGANSHVGFGQVVAPDTNASTILYKDASWPQMPLDTPQMAQTQQAGPSLTGGLDITADAPFDDYIWPIPGPDMYCNQFGAQEASGVQHQFSQDLSPGTNAFFGVIPQPAMEMATPKSLAGAEAIHTIQQPLVEYETMADQAPDPETDLESALLWSFPWLK
ncbi:hypothetical protein TWF106_007672 [Orbilia oligospora]|uniref:Uncharacterized protein n=1 Tax=Orbilia oligospora TaxID=2813651 RepID=A0A7C8UIX8_ORBOL|nr:hypothetical protein TWF106_007672 [Orbilia oligospora]